MGQTRWRGPALVGLAGLLLAGCTEYQPVHWGGAVPWEQARRAIYEERDGRSRPVPENARHVVMPGETMSELAVLYRVPMAELVALNGMVPPYHIHVGQVLRLPGPDAPRPADGRTHLVARGDTLSGIAAAYNVKLGDVIALNRGVDPARLHVGSAVRLPAGAGTQVARATPPQPPATPAAAPGRASPSASPSLAGASPSPAPARSVPAQSAPAPAQASPAAPASQIVARELPPPAGTPAPRPEPGMAATTSTTTSTAGAAAPPDAARDAARQRDLAAVAAPGLSGDGFLWPVDSGALISGFGAKPDGRRNDGINIAAPAGTIVRAAENGLVVYADEDLAAFGRMLLVRHADGYLTAYAHNDALLVARGDLVARGQPIAKVGQSGEVVEPQLHFEIRQGKSAVDPVRLLGDGAVRIAQRN